MSGAGMLIESVGVYLPETERTTDEVLAGCANRIRFPIERRTGIRSRRVAGDAEFAFDLARKAVEACLTSSRHEADDVDLLVSAAISRCDGPGLWLTFEPSTAVRLKHEMGFGRALTFDLLSACSGMFAAMWIVDRMLRRHSIERALVVSGEYISLLGETAQQEIEGVLDSRLACLTLGDAGAAVLLERAPHEGVGFAALELCTLGGGARHCIGRPTKEEHGGPIMYTDAVRLTAGAVKHGSRHALATMERAGWSPDSFEHLIMHQTSRTTLASASKEINRRLRRSVCHPGNMIDNLGERGNTASTAHFVALVDHIRSGRIRSGDSVVFAISGSGQTLGTGLYKLDDLPDRVRDPAGGPTDPEARRDGRPFRAAYAPGALALIKGIGTARPADGQHGETLDLLGRATLEALDAAGRDRSEVDLLIFAGTYRTDYILEPAVAALLAGDLDINAGELRTDGGGTLAFDVMNGALGPLNACHVGAEMILAGAVETVLIVTAEIENNARVPSVSLLGLRESGAALVLERGEDAVGFRHFAFTSATHNIRDFTSRCVHADGSNRLCFERAVGWERRVLDEARSAIEATLSDAFVTLADIAWIVGPQISPAFTDSLSRTLGAPRSRFVEAAYPGQGDLHSASMPFGLHALTTSGCAASGDVVLMVSVAAGLQIGCALYVL